MESAPEQTPAPEMPAPETAPETPAQETAQGTPAPETAPQTPAKETPPKRLELSAEAGFRRIYRGEEDVWEAAVEVSEVNVEGVRVVGKETLVPLKSGEVIRAVHPSEAAARITLREVLREVAQPCKEIIKERRRALRNSDEGRKRFKMHEELSYAHQAVYKADREEFGIADLFEVCRMDTERFRRFGDDAARVFDRYVAQARKVVVAEMLARRAQQRVDEAERAYKQKEDEMDEKA